ncbi:hypothetical protein [Nocardia xishanensis]|uniref:hypothetical protein n=1 Tax=Nocardia xishanensis TaxID=238964 RepID=UPI0034350382
MCHRQQRLRRLDHAREVDKRNAEYGRKILDGRDIRGDRNAHGVRDLRGARNLHGVHNTDSDGNVHDGRTIDSGRNTHNGRNVDRGGNTHDSRHIDRGGNTHDGRAIDGGRTIHSLIIDRDRNVEGSGLVDDGGNDLGWPYSNIWIIEFGESGRYRNHVRNFENSDAGNLDRLGRGLAGAQEQGADRRRGGGQATEDRATQEARISTLSG